MTELGLISLNYSDRMPRQVRVQHASSDTIKSNLRIRLIIMEENTHGRGLADAGTYERGV